jgi:hypothetical protein
MQEEDSELTQAAIALANATVTLTEAIATVKELLENRIGDSVWLTPRQAATRLGVKPIWILARIRDGRYKLGVHYVNTSDGDRPTYLVSLGAIQNEMVKPPEKRKPAKR